MIIVLKSVDIECFTLKRRFFKWWMYCILFRSSKNLLYLNETLRIISDQREMLIVNTTQKLSDMTSMPTPVTIWVSHDPTVTCPHPHTSTSFCSLGHRNLLYRCMREWTTMINIKWKTNYICMGKDHEDSSNASI